MLTSISNKNNNIIIVDDSTNTAHSVQLQLRRQGLAPAGPTILTIDNASGPFVQRQSINKRFRPTLTGFCLRGKRRQPSRPDLTAPLDSGNYGKPSFRGARRSTMVTAPAVSSIHSFIHPLVSTPVNNLGRTPIGGTRPNSGAAAIITLMMTIIIILHYSVTSWYWPVIS